MNSSIMKSDNVTTVRVELAERAYDIAIGGGLLAETGARIARLRPKAKAVIVSDTNVAKFHLESCERSLGAADIKSHKVVVAAGESSKSYATYQQVMDAILDARIERGDLLVALGGGVVGDLAGFAAATVLRGIDFVQIPTSLLAQVDSAVGGKTGIDTRQGKNLVGAFHQPIMVLADTGVLDTLPPRQFRSGYAEVAKYGLINDEKFFAWLEKNWQAVFKGGPERIEAVAASCRAKAAIVGRDEREAGERALLNLGHTFAHALEAATGYSERLLHGEAVAVGMVLAHKLSVKLGLCSEADAARATAHLAAVGLPTKLSDIPGSLPGSAALIDLMGTDKKVEHGSLVFILTRGIGKAFVAKGVEIGPVRALLDEAGRGA
jgi:3-dehydroquinate synthase